MKTHVLLLAAFLSAFAFLSAQADNKAPSPAKLSAREEKDVRRIEAYLNEFKSVSADFLQIGDNGGLRQGAISIERPGKMRVTYDSPSQDFMVADGSFLHMWDGDMKQQTSVPIGTSIASFILRDDIKLSGDIILTRFVRYPAKIELDLVSKESPEEGELTLVFEDNPLKLRQWRVLDPQGHVTGINLENAQEGVKFSEDTFVFVSPKMGQSARTSKK